MRQLFDSITAANIPADAELVAGYIDGRYAWRPADWARFPHAKTIRIAVFATTDDGNCLDVETGDATPSQAPPWVTRRRAAGVDPWVYCNTATWPAVRGAFRAAGVTEPWYWIAAYPGVGPRLYPGSVAHQYADPGPIDISVVADFLPGIDPPPGAAPPPIETVQEDEMQPVVFTYINPATKVSALYLTADGATFEHVTSMDEAADRLGVLTAITGKPPIHWNNDQPVGDILAFGRPVDKETADIAGLPWPAPPAGPGS